MTNTSRRGLIVIPEVPESTSEVTILFHAGDPQVHSEDEEDL